MFLSAAAVGYVRVSTDEQTATPSEQRRAIERLAERKGWRLLGVYEDIGVSGATDPLSRSGFRRAIEELAGAGGGFLVAWSIDRISRQPLADVYRLIAELARRNILVYTVLEEPVFQQLYGDNPMALAQARLFFEMRAAFAWFEREMTRMRMKIAMQNPTVKEHLYDGLQRAGLTVTRRLPEETRRKILELRRQGLSIRRIAEKLGLTYYAVYKVVKEAGEPGPDTRTCPRCFHRMVEEPGIPPRLRCKKCGYEVILWNIHREKKEAGAPQPTQ